MSVYFLPFKNIFHHLKKKIIVSRQFSIHMIGNFGTDQLRDMGRIQWWVSCMLTIGVQANVAFGNTVHAWINLERPVLSSCRSA